MTGIEATEAAKYRRVWAMPEYRIVCHSMDIWVQHPEMFPKLFHSALDIGCGLGRLFSAWNFAGIDAWAVDLVDECLEPDVRRSWGHKFSRQNIWSMIWDRRFDLGICTDVMEHIPPALVKDALIRIAACCDDVVFKIANFTGNDLGGPPLHLTLKPADFWLQQMEVVAGKAVLVRDYQHRPGLPDFIVRWRVNG